MKNIDNLNNFKKLKRKQIKILIPNATSPRNIGDQAMLDGLIFLLKNEYKSAKIKIHSVDPNVYDRKVDYQIDHTLYSWSVLKNRNAFPKFINLSKLVLQYIFLRLGIFGLGVDRQLTSLINDYKNADLIVFAGGGYLRSRKGIKQSLNLFMQLLHFKFAELFSAKKIVSPISVGPFGCKWQEKIVAGELSKMDLVAVREEISYKMLEKYKMKNLILSSDFALLIKKINKKKVNSDFTLGFTVREWLKGNKYKKFEDSFVESIQKFSKNTGAKIQPIVQVDASMYGEDDASVTKKIAEKLGKKKLGVSKIIKINNVNEALDVYSNIDLLLGMRMHSNIFAAIQGTPFVALSYEYKTEGIAKQLSMEKYCIRCEDVNKDSLYKILMDAYKNRSYLRKELINSVEEIQNREIKRWGNILCK